MNKNWTKGELWHRFQTRFHRFHSLGLGVDLSRMNFGDDFITAMQPHMQRAFAAMADLVRGAIANPDEKRMVGHYWLRNAALAPTTSIRQEIQATLNDVTEFAASVHSGVTHGARVPFKNLLVIGIGGSALGPQFIAHALGHPAQDKLKPLFLDNTDPDGIDRVLIGLGDLGQTLCLVISKSGETIETRNGMLETRAAFERANLQFHSHAVAVTRFDSRLDRIAAKEDWLRRFPMWDWVGGRTSVFSAVGLLPAALQGIDIKGMIAGARACDDVTSNDNVIDNPAALLALMWYFIDNGTGEKDMVILPYKDRLEWFSRYLQQLVMESLGKELDLNGRVVHQGRAVYGNKGSTDQHAYVQQLRDGLPNFFVTFIEVLKDRTGASIEVEPGITTGDYLHGFLHGTRQALFEKGRQSITISIKEVSPFTLGVLIALYERAVGFYATLININAYHQPGVEAGKIAAGELIKLRARVLTLLREARGQPLTVEEIATRLREPDEAESIFNICEHLAANPERGVQKRPGATPFQSTYYHS